VIDRKTRLPTYQPINLPAKWQLETLSGPLSQAKPRKSQKSQVMDA
jgi:hypothetical protein